MTKKELIEALARFDDEDVIHWQERDQETGKYLSGQMGVCSVEMTSPPQIPWRIIILSNLCHAGQYESDRSLWPEAEARFEKCAKKLRDGLAQIEAERLAAIKEKRILSLATARESKKAKKRIKERHE